MIFQSWEMGGFNDAGDGLRFIAEHEVKWGFASGGVRVVVVDELSHGDVVSPSFRVRTAKDVEVGLNLLVESLCFSIGLRVVCCGQGDFISKYASKFSKNDGSDSIGSDCFLRWA